MRHTPDMRAVRLISAALALAALVLANQAWGQSRGIEVAVKAEEGSVETVRLYSQAYAVIIGIDRYENLPPGSELSYAVGDAQGVAEVLERDYAFDGITTLYNETRQRRRSSGCSLRNLAAPPRMIQFSSSGPAMP